MNTFRNFSKCLLFAMAIFSKGAFAADTPCPTALPVEPLWNPPAPYSSYTNNFWRSVDGGHTAVREAGQFGQFNVLIPNGAGQIMYYLSAKCVDGAWVADTLKGVINERLTNGVTGAVDLVTYSSEQGTVPLTFNMYSWKRTLPRSSDLNHFAGDHSVVEANFVLKTKDPRTSFRWTYGMFDMTAPVETFLFDNIDLISSDSSGYFKNENWTDEFLEQNRFYPFKTKSSITTWTLSRGIQKRKSDVRWEYVWIPVPPPGNNSLAGQYKEAKKDVTIKVWDAKPNDAYLPSSEPLYLERTYLTLTARTYKPGYPRSFDFSMRLTDAGQTVINSKATRASIDYGKRSYSIPQSPMLIWMWQPLQVTLSDGQFRYDCTVPTRFVPEPCTNKHENILLEMFAADIDKVITPTDPKQYMQFLGAVPADF